MVLRILLNCGVVIYVYYFFIIIYIVDVGNYNLKIKYLHYLKLSSFKNFCKAYTTSSLTSFGDKENPLINKFFFCITY